MNGNHVIQKCLVYFKPEHNQFIYNSIASNVVLVATHRHGCCVIQRCIDHAKCDQKEFLVNQIISHGLALVQVNTLFLILESFWKLRGPIYS